MKTTRRILALVIAMVIAVAMAAPAMAASITINDKTPGGTVSTSYTYYQLFHASINGDAFSYYLVNGTDDSLRTLLDEAKVDNADLFTFTQSADGARWTASINNKADGSAYTDADAEKIAEALNTDAIKNVALAHGDFTSSNGKAEAAGLTEGYYLITSTLGSKLVVQTLKDVTIDTKNEYITNVKTADKTNMGVGDQVTYTITVSIPDTSIVDDIVTVHDTLDSHLAILKEDGTIATSATDYHITATVGTAGSSVALSDGTAKTGETFAKSFTVTQEMITAGFVVLKYKAELLSTAVGGTEYGNAAYSHTSAYETQPSTVNVWTFSFDLDKNFQDIAGDAAANYEATFELTDSDDNPIDFTRNVNTYTKADSNDANAESVLTVNGKDNITILGLAAGTYTLTEKTTANGYNLLTESITVTIEDTTNTVVPNANPSCTVSYKIGTGATATGTVTVSNNHGSLLPTTGGIGTTIFYVVGGLLAFGALVLLITKRRMNGKD